MKPIGFGQLSSHIRFNEFQFSLHSQGFKRSSYYFLGFFKNDYHTFKWVQYQNRNKWGDCWIKVLIFLYDMWRGKARGLFGLKKRRQYIYIITWFVFPNPVFCLHLSARTLNATWCGENGSGLILGQQHLHEGKVWVPRAIQYKKEQEERRFAFQYKKRIKGDVGINHHQYNYKSQW